MKKAPSVRSWDRRIAAAQRAAARARKRVSAFRRRRPPEEFRAHEFLDRNGRIVWLSALFDLLEGGPGGWGPRFRYR